MPAMMDYADAGPTMIDAMNSPGGRAFMGTDINDARMSDLLFVPRLGDATKSRLSAAGITTVKQLVGMFWVKETPEAFKEWLEGTGVQAAINTSGAITIVINNYCVTNGL